jgi:hypothetical protein
MNFQEFEQQIATYKKQQRYADMLQFFKLNKASFTSEQIASNGYLISNMLMALRKTGNFNAVDAFLKIYHQKIGSGMNPMVINAYGWVVFDKYKHDNEASNNFNSYQFLTNVQRLLPLLTAQNNNFAYSVIARILNIVLKTEKHKASVNWKFISDFCSLFDPNILNNSCDLIEVTRKGRTANMELASDKEAWYAAKSKALIELNQMEACFNISKEALHVIEKFHYSNDLWFARRVALAKKSFGNSDETIAELKMILKKKREWFIQRELAELYFEQNNSEEAFAYAIQAMNNYGDLEYKVGLIAFLGDLLVIKGEKPMAYKHFLLAKQLREKEEWKIPPELLTKLEDTKDANGAINFQSLKRELKSYWQSFQPKRMKSENNGEKLVGTIKKILNDNEKGKNGFLTSLQGNDYYFVIPRHISFTSKVELGVNVEFVPVANNQDKGDKAKIIRVIDTKN